MNNKKNFDESIKKIKKTLESVPYLNTIHIVM